MHPLLTQETVEDRFQLLLGGVRHLTLGSVTLQELLRLSPAAR